MKICVFCSSSDAVSQEYFAAAAAMGALIGSGGPHAGLRRRQVGLMGAVARAAHEAGGRVVGIIPVHEPHRRAPMRSATSSS